MAMQGQGKLLLALHSCTQKPLVGRGVEDKGSWGKAVLMWPAQGPPSKNGLHWAAWKSNSRRENLTWAWGCAEGSVWHFWMRLPRVSCWGLSTRRSASVPGRKAGAACLARQGSGSAGIWRPATQAAGVPAQQTVPAQRRRAGSAQVRLQLRHLLGILFENLRLGPGRAAGSAAWVRPHRT